VNFGEFLNRNITLQVVNKITANGVNPKDAPISQIRIRECGSILPPPTGRFSNTHQRAATRAMQEEMFFS
jgi:hypothetical protein